VGARASLPAPEGVAGWARDAVSGPSPSEEGVAATNPPAARRRSAGWLAVPPSPAPEGVGAVGLPVHGQAFVVPKNIVDLCVFRGFPPSGEGGSASGGRSLSLCSLVAEPKPVDSVAFPRLGGQAPSVEVAPGFGPSPEPRLRVWSAAGGGFCGFVRLGPFRFQPRLARSGPPLPSPEPRRTLEPGGGPSPAEAGVVGASSLSRLANQAGLGLPSAPASEPAFAVGEVAAALLPVAEALGLGPWRRDRRPSKEFIHVKERSVKNAGR